jgi:hypothetical protein
MPTIRCAPALWRFVRAWRSVHGPQTDGAESRLGPWDATVIAARQAELVLAVESRTCLALVFELGAEATFAAAWKRALTAVLHELGVAPARIALEIASTSFRLETLRDPPATAMLADVRFVCETELHYQSDLRVVQCRVNEFPHNHPPDYTAADAIRRVFEVRA